MTTPFDFKKLLAQAQEMQAKMQTAQEELSRVVVTGESGGGLIKVDLDGRHAIKAIWLDPSLFSDYSRKTSEEEKDHHKAFVEDLLKAAFNAAIEKIEKTSRQKLVGLTSMIQSDFTNPLSSESDS